MTGLSNVKHFVGRAAPIKQVDTITLGGTWSAGEKITITLGTIQISHTVVAGATATSDIIDALALVHEEYRLLYGQVYETVFESADPVITISSYTPGYGYTIAVTEDAASGTATLSNVTTATGPGYLDNEDNYLEGSVPSSSDIVIFENGSQDVWGGLDSIDTYDIIHRATHTGKIGLPAINRWNPSLPYPEYRDRYLERTNTNDIYGEGSGDSLPFLALDLQTDGGTYEITTDTSDGITIEINDSDGGSNACSITINRGNAKLTGIDTSTITLNNTGFVEVFQSPDNTINNRGSTLTINDSTGLSFTQTAGTTLTKGTTTITTGPAISGGTFTHMAGTLSGNMTLSGTAVFVVGSSFTISNAIKLYNSAGYQDPNSYIAAPVLQFEKGASLANTDLGESFQITRANY